MVRSYGRQRPRIVDSHESKRVTRQQKTVTKHHLPPTAGCFRDFLRELDTGKSWNLSATLTETPVVTESDLLVSVFVEPGILRGDLVMRRDIRRRHWRRRGEKRSGYTMREAVIREEERSGYTMREAVIRREKRL